jgi:osmotically-inducible protein OsmY
LILNINRRILIRKTGGNNMKTDVELQRDVLAEIRYEPSILNPANIGVAVTDGIIGLSGYVDSYTEKWAAERAAKKVSGVKAVAVEIEVKLPGSSVRNDAEIAAAAASALSVHTWIPYNKLKVSVQNGMITLEGEVEWWYQKEAAENAVRNLIGANGVINEISVKPTVKPTEIKSRIESALERHAILDTRRINVEARGNKVILTGKVHSIAEKEAAEAAVCNAPGVSEIENNILVAV